MRKTYKSLQSIGLKTNCFLSEHEGEVEVFDDYIVIKTKSAPEYHWGNYMIFKMPPEIDDYDKWYNLFNFHFDCDPLVQHKTFTWDNIHGKAGAIEPFLVNGFEVDKTTILTASDIMKASNLNKDLKIKFVSKDSEWDTILKNKLSLKPEGMLEKEYEKFLRKKIKNYKNMIAQGIGQWFVGYFGKELACDLGIFWKDGIGRFQSVFTSEKFRRQRACTTLVTESTEYAFKKLNLKTLVIEADSDYVAAKIYESIGFEKKEELLGICKWERQ